ncbi:MAG: dienelactone hydrolase family protein [Hydrogenophaga sp.]|uniref:alpha/beta hydrolase n=1 Tax=Hydrogenophaga sp. TaxID=1904254 RepID=UPI00261CE89A|nr:dienelactone hydrolase family protein [Hydrogenophaga sp.]MCW5671706.1 dienelactone hydrolase family protein [Hydrogenophaga sp.]
MNTPFLETLEALSGGDAAAQPVASIIVLHGLGADGNDFVPIARELDLSTVGPVRFVFPSAPVQPVTLNGGYRMRAWYDIHPPSANPAVPRLEDEPGLRAAQGLVQGLIDREVTRGVPAHRIVLMGFSQGCAMTLMTGLRAPQRLAGLVGLSGYLPIAGTTDAERGEANRATPIFLAHGEDDPMVTIDRAIASRDELQRLGYDVEWHTYPMEHTVSTQEVDDLNAWLLKVLSAP